MNEKAELISKILSIAEGRDIESIAMVYDELHGEGSARGILLSHVGLDLMPHKTAKIELTTLDRIWSKLK